MKIINEAITVQLNPSREEMPRMIEWRGCTYSVVQVADQWMVKTKWWADEVTRHFVVLLTDSFVMEVYHDLQSNSWVLYRLYGG